MQNTRTRTADRMKLNLGAIGRLKGKALGRLLRWAFSLWNECGVLRSGFHIGYSVILG
jgi:hypothetical protein